MPTPKAVHRFSYPQPLQNKRFTSSNCKDIEIKKIEFVQQTRCYCLFSKLIVQLNYFFIKTVGSREE